MPRPVIYHPELSREDAARLRARECYQNNKQKYLDYQKQYSIDKPHMIRKRNLKKYNISVEEYDDLLVRQGGCAICGGNRTKRRLAVDHDHETGENRSLLCAKCNCGIGQFDDCPEILEAAIVYLRSFENDTTGRN